MVRLLSVKPAYVHELCRTGRLQAMKSGKYWMISVAGLRRCLMSGNGDIDATVANDYSRSHLTPMPDGRVPRLRSRGEMRRPARAQGLRMTRARIRVRYRKNRALWEADYRDAAGVHPGRELVRLTRVRRYRVRAER
jgi:hypothetical protein